MKSPIFLFSLPRSGSTLLQRILMSHDQIASVAEPWILLPYLYTFRHNGILAEYSHTTSYHSIHDFIDNLPGKQADYLKELRAFTFALYEKHCTHGEQYFLDKTPRYYHIIKEISTLFPEAKFIFLFRNPVHIFSSIMETWLENKFKNLYKFHIDLIEGPALLAEGYKLLGKKAISVRYEDMVGDPGRIIKYICSYLEIDYNQKMLSAFSFQNTRGRLGDPIGVHLYKHISTASLNKWQDTFASSYRKKVIKNYILNIDKDVFNLMGYDRNEILQQIDSLKGKISLGLQDRKDLFYSKLVRNFKLNIFFGKKTKSWAHNRYLS